MLSSHFYMVKKKINDNLSAIFVKESQKSASTRRLYLFYTRNYYSKWWNENIWRQWQLKE